MENHKATLKVKCQRLKRSKRIETDADIFSEEVIMLELHDKVIFRRAGIDDNKTYHFQKRGRIYRTCMVTNIEEGVYIADEEESNEDEIVIYYEQ